MRLARKAAVVVMTAAASIGGSAATATAATSAPAATPAACGWTAPLGGNYYAGEAEYWLSYNTCNRTVRGAVEVLKATSTNWQLWVYNEDTGAEKVIVVDSNDPNQAGNQYTVPISDAGTESHVCVQPYGYNGQAQGTKACTGYY
jgi:hypothetical protein